MTVAGLNLLANGHRHVSDESLAALALQPGPGSAARVHTGDSKSPGGAGDELEDRAGPWLRGGPAGDRDWDQQLDCHARQQLAPAPPGCRRGANSDPASGESPPPGYSSGHSDGTGDSHRDSGDGGSRRRSNPVTDTVT